MKHQNDELPNTLTQFMGFIVAPTDSDWIRHLRDFGNSVTEVNFWRPGGTNLSQEIIEQKQRIVFVEKGPSPRKIAGHARIESFSRMTVSDAWTKFGRGNGAESLEQLEDRLGILRDGAAIVDIGKIGCISLSDVIFFDEGSEIPVDLVFDGSNEYPKFQTQVVTYKKYDSRFPPMLNLIISDTIESESDGKRGVISQELKTRIEKHAINLCFQAFSEENPLSVESSADAIKHTGVAYPGYDVLCKKNGLKIEVKGTTSSEPWTVRVSGNEMNTALNDADWRLFVVSDILIDFDSDEVVHGGKCELYKFSMHEKLRALGSIPEEIAGISVSMNWFISEGSTILETM